MKIEDFTLKQASEICNRYDFPCDGCPFFEGNYCGISDLIPGAWTLEKEVDASEFLSDDSK